MGKTKAVKAVCILLAVVLMFGVFNVYTTAMSALPDSSALHHLQEAPEYRHLESSLYYYIEAVAPNDNSISYHSVTFPENFLQLESEINEAIGFTGETVWACPEEEEYYKTHGRHLDHMRYLQHISEYYSFRASGMWFAEFLELRASGMWFCELANMWVDPVEHGITFLWELPFVDEPWIEDGEILEIWGETVWACPEEEEYFMTHGRHLDVSLYIDMVHYQDFRASGMSLVEFQAFSSVARVQEHRNNVVIAEDGGSSSFWDLPIVDEPWLEDSELLKAREEIIWTWACPDEEEYYMTHGRMRDLSDYLNTPEYVLFRASGLRLAEFEAMRASGLSLAEMRVQLTPDVVAFGMELNSTCFYDLPIVEEEWLDDYAILPFFTTMATTPLLTVTRNATESNAVNLTGNITSTGGAPIIARGFWIRRSTETGAREVLVSGTTNTFSHRITGLTSNARYHTRAIARNSVATGTGQSGELIFVTLPNTPTGLRATSGVGQVTINWSAPANNGGAETLRYEVSVGTGSWINASGMSHTFTGLSSGTHTFRVRAVNSAGVSPFISTTASPTEVSLPTLTASRNSTESTAATLTGTITNTGGATIIARGFWIRRSNETSAREVLVSTTNNTFSHRITGLIPNSRYHARAIARNNVRTGTGQSDEIIFITLPNPPTSLSATSGVGQVTINWSAPSSNGGAETLSYDVSLNGVTWIRASGMSHTFTGLSNSTHTFRVRAINSAGVSTTASVTGAPIAVSLPRLTLTRGRTESSSVVLNGSIYNTGGAPITARGFWIRRSNQVTSREVLVNTTSNTFTDTITGLVPGSTYHVHAIARNSGISGTGQSSEIVFVTPTVPGIPRSFSATPEAGQATIRWLAPTSNGGAVITSYQVSANNGTWVTAQSMTEHTFFGLSPGRNTFRVRAVNSVGAGAYANAEAVVGAVTVTLTFDANGGTPATQPIIRQPGAGNTIGALPPSPTRENHTFVAWYNTSAATGGARITGNTAVPASNTTYWARWTAATLELPINTWNITAAANTETFTVISNSAWTASSSNTSWLRVVNTAPGSVTVVADANTGTVQRTGTITIFIPGAGITRNISVTQFPPIRINLDANGGTVSPQFVTIPQNPVGNVLPTPTRLGVPAYMFAGWFTAPTGGQQVFSNSMVNSGATLFARWHVHISFNPNGGAGNTRTYDWLAGMQMGALLDTIPVPTRVGVTLGQRFDGWFTSQHGGTRVTPETLAQNNHMALYARWVNNTDPDRHMPYWWQSNRIPLQTFRIDPFLPPEWETGMERGRLAWNNSGAPVTFDVLPLAASNNPVNAQPRMFNSLGRIYYPITLGTSLSRFHIQLNSRTITNHARIRGYTLENVIASVMAHELAHVIGLEDNPSTANANDSLMRHGRSRNNITTPQAFDIESVRMIYD